MEELLKLIAVVNAFRLNVPLELSLSTSTLRTRGSSLKCLSAECTLRIWLRQTTSMLRSTWGLKCLSAECTLRMAVDEVEVCLAQGRS